MMKHGLGMGILTSQPSAKPKFGYLKMPMRVKCPRSADMMIFAIFFLSPKFGEGCQTRGVPHGDCQWYTKVCLPAMIQTRATGRLKTGL